MLKRIVYRLQSRLLQNYFIRIDMYSTEKGEKRSASEETDVPTSDSCKKQKTEGNPDRKRKCAIMFGYNGKGYHGLQRNPGFKTLEEDLCKALLDAGLIPAEHFEYMQKMSFQRAARTDKGVSAAGNLVSLKMLMNKENLVQEINSHLPSQIRVFDCLRTTQSFNSKNFCDARTYIYVLPTYAFLHKDQALTTEYKMDGNTLEKVNEVLEMFRGTHNFHNYTSGLSADDRSATRFIMDFECRTPFVRHGVEFCEIAVKGQSFMMHQIRKMVGTVIAVMKGYVEPSFIEETLKHDRICLPKAPGLGLVLDKLHYPGYNKRFGHDHKPIDFEAIKDQTQAFKDEIVLSEIYKTELEEYSMLKWLPEMDMFTFEIEKENEREIQTERHKFRDERILMTCKFIYGPDYEPPKQTSQSVCGPDGKSTDSNINTSANQDSVHEGSTSDNTAKLTNENEARLIEGQDEKLDLPQVSVSEEAKGNENKDEEKVVRENDKGSENKDVDTAVCENDKGSENKDEDKTKCDSDKSSEHKLTSDSISR